MTIPLVIPPYEPIAGRVGFAQPFTISDSESYLSKLERLATFINQVIEQVNGGFLKNDEFFSSQLNSLIAEVNTQLDSQGEYVTQEIATAVGNVNTAITNLNAAVDMKIGEITATAEAWMETTIENNDIITADIFDDANSMSSKARDAHDRKRTGVYSVLDFGAVADSTAAGVGTDNHAAFTAAIAATPHGARLIVPAGRYYLSNTLILDRAIDFDCGTGASPAFSQVGVELIFAAGVGGIHVKSDAGGQRPTGWRVGPFQLTSLSTAAGVGDGILVTDGPGVLDHVKVQRFPGAGIHLKAGASYGGGNVNNTVMYAPRVYANYGNGITVEGTDAQMAKILWPDISSNYGWGIETIGASTTRVLFPHFDQSWNGSPGAIKDRGISNSYIDVYMEGGNNGALVQLEPTSSYTYVTFSVYAKPTINDLTAGKSAYLFDTQYGQHYRSQVFGRAKTRFKTEVDLSAVGSASSYVQLEADGAATEVQRMSKTGFYIGAPLLPLGGTDIHDIGSGSSRFRNLHLSGYVKTGSYTTATRPSATTSGVGARIYDTTLTKPLWSDGTVWRDAMGAAV